MSEEVTYALLCSVCGEFAFDMRQHLRMSAQKARMRELEMLMVAFGVCKARAFDRCDLAKAVCNVLFCIFVSFITVERLRRTVVTHFLFLPSDRYCCISVAQASLSPARCILCPHHMQMRRRATHKCTFVQAPQELPTSYAWRRTETMREWDYGSCAPLDAIYLLFARPQVPRHNAISLLLCFSVPSTIETSTYTY